MDPDDPNFLNNIQKLRSAYQDGDIQALEEMIQIYNDDDQHIKTRIEAGRMAAEWNERIKQRKNQYFPTQIPTRT